MKIHAPIFLPPPPAPPAATAATARSDSQLPTAKAHMAFDESLGARSASDRPTQAGHGNRGNRSDAASRRQPASAPASPPAAPTASTEEAAEATAESPYTPGSIIDIEA